MGRCRRVLLVDEAGGRASDKEGEFVLFNRADTLINGVIAATSGAYDHIRMLIAKKGVGGERGLAACD